MLEIKKYVENNLSYKKEQIKNNKGDKSRGKELYFNFLKKVLFINLDNEIEIKKLKEKIDENFKNVFMQHVLDYGKVLYYKEIDDHIKSKNEIETSDLEYIKTKETVIRKMATLVAFATNSFYGIVSNSVEKDVLGRKWTKDDIDKKQLNRFFDINDIKDDEDKIVEFLEMIDFSIYNVHNGVGHFDKMNLGNYDHKYECKKSKIETEIKTKDKNKDLSKNDEIKNYFRKKIDNMENNIKEKFLSNNIYKYYNKESTEQYFKIYRFYLLKSKASFAPNFKRIMKKGKDLYLNQNQNENKQRYKYFYEDNSENNQDEKDKKDTFYNTKRFLLKELYYNNFYEEFLEDRVNFEKIIDNVKRNKENRGKKIEEENKKKRNKSSEEEKFGVAFNNILKYNKEYDIAGYITLVHKKEMERIEKSLRQEKQKDTSGYVRDFIEEIFLEGFIQYLDKNKLEFIAKEIDNETDNIKNELEDLEINIEDKDKLNETDDILLNLYLFFNMIDGKRLSEFRNELIKYKQFINKRSNINQEFLGIKIEDYELLVEFVILTREKLETDKNDNNTILVDRLYNQENERYKEYDDILEKFIDEDLIRKEYCQEDNKTPIIYSNFEKTKKYFTQTVLEKVQKDYKYTIKDNEELITLEKKDSDNKTLQKQKSDLHIEWEEFKRKKEKHFGKEEKYKKLATNVRRYNYLRNKKELQNVYFLHEILSDILGRNIAFINKWERDFKFLTIAIRKFLNNLEEIKKINNFLDPSNDISNVDDEVYFSVKNYRKYLREISGLHDNLIGLIFLKNAHFQNGISIQNKRYNWIDFRNYIAHFEHLHKGKTNINLIDQVNFLIKLFEYDKKVQNHITKSIKTIIEKYNMEIEFKIDDTKETFEYKIKSLKSKKGKILGKENEFEILEKEFVENIKVLLEYSN